MITDNLWTRRVLPGVLAIFGLATNVGWALGPPVPKTSVWMAARPMARAESDAMPTMPPSTPWNGVVYLRPPNLARLESLASAVSSPSSAQYHHFWTRAEVVKAFSPVPTEVRSVSEALRQEGFRVQGTTGLGVGIRVSGTVGLVNRVWAAGLRKGAEGVGIETRAVKLTGVLAESVTYISDLTAPSYLVPPVVRQKPDSGGSPAKVTVASASNNISVTVQGPTTVPSGQNILVSVSVVNPTTRFPLKGWDISATPSPNAVLSSYQVSDLNGKMALSKSGSDVLVLSSSSPYHGPWKISVSSGNTTYTATVKGLSWTGPTVVSNDLSPHEINTAYDANGLVAAATAAGGMRIGIFGDSRPTMSDLTMFETRYHLPKSKVNVVPVDGGEKKAISGWHGELMLDMERSVSSAPGATLDLYIVPPSGSITDAVAAAINQGVDQVFSISAVEPEDSISARHLAIWNTLMAEGSLEGITFVAGSGDSGPYGNPSSSTPDPNWPASSDWVTAVGGTQLGLNPSTDAIQSQWAWSPDGLWDNQVDGSGGGFSKIQAVPAWQKGIVSASATGRGVPDLAFLAAEPYYAAVDHSVWEGMAGTSASTPTWAGWVADLDVLIGRQGFMNPTLYATYTRDPSAFDPVVHGGNAVYQAGPGWNPVTGLGSVVVDRFWQDDTIAALKASTTKAHAAVGTPITVTVQLRNRRGQAAPVAGVALKMASAGPAVSVNGEPAGLGAVANSDGKGEAVFSVVSRQAGSFRFTISVENRGRVTPETVVMTWTGTDASVAPFADSIKVAGFSADAAAETVFPSAGAPRTAVVVSDPSLSPQLAWESVALAAAVQGPIFFTNRHGALPTATLATFRHLNISRVVVVGDLTRTTMDLPSDIEMVSKLWTPSEPALLLEIAKAVVSRTKRQGVVVASTRAPTMLLIAAASLASHRKVGLLLVGPGPMAAETKSFLRGQKTMWEIGAPTLPKSGHFHATDIIQKTEEATLIQVDRLNRSGPNDLVAFNPDSFSNPAVAILTAEVAARWATALVPVGSKTVPTSVDRYLSALPRAQIENLFLVGTDQAVATAVERLFHPLTHR